MSAYRDPTAYVPHRPPILCIDAVRKIEGGCVHTEASVPTDTDLMWEPWLVEGLAQTAAVHNGHHGDRRSDAKGMLVGIRGLKIHRRPRAGETLRYEATLLSELGPVSLFEGAAFVGEERVAVGELKFFVEA